MSVMHAAGAEADAAAGGRARQDQQVVGPHAGDRLLHRGLRALADLRSWRSPRATPMITPRAVSAERILFRRKRRQARVRQRGARHERRHGSDSRRGFGRRRRRRTERSRRRDGRRRRRPAAVRPSGSSASPSALPAADVPACLVAFDQAVARCGSCDGHRRPPSGRASPG